MPTILSLDPGETTGVAIIGFDPKRGPAVTYCDQITGGPVGFIRWFKSLPTDWYDEIVCESFVLRPGVHGANITPAYVIGALEAMAEVPITYQSPSQKKLVPDETLKRGQTTFIIGKPHATDAVRHGIIYLRNMGHKNTLKRFWPED
jgi:hypothetical protein